MRVPRTSIGSTAAGASRGSLAGTSDRARSPTLLLPPTGNAPPLEGTRPLPMRRSLLSWPSACSAVGAKQVLRPNRLPAHARVGTRKTRKTACAARSCGSKLGHDLRIRGSPSVPRLGVGGMKSLKMLSISSEGPRPARFHTGPLPHGLVVQHAERRRRLCIRVVVGTTSLRGGDGHDRPSRRRRARHPPGNDGADSLDAEDTRQGSAVARGGADSDNTCRTDRGGLRSSC